MDHVDLQVKHAVEDSSFQLFEIFFKCYANHYNFAFLNNFFIILINSLKFTRFDDYNIEI